MSLSRREVQALRAAGWTVIEYSPWAALRRLLRRRPVARPLPDGRWLP
jgi:hypothetical protein